MAQTKIRSDQIDTTTAFIETPSSAPTNDYQVANKKYVDDNAGGGGGSVAYDVEKHMGLSGDSNNRAIASGAAVLGYTSGGTTAGSYLGYATASALSSGANYARLAVIPGYKSIWFDNNITTDIFAYGAEFTMEAWISIDETSNRAFLGFAEFDTGTSAADFQFDSSSDVSIGFLITGDTTTGLRVDTVSANGSNVQTTTDIDTGLDTKAGDDYFVSVRCIITDQIVYSVNGGTAVTHSTVVPTKADSTDGSDRWTFVASAEKGNSVLGSVRIDLMSVDFKYNLQ